MALVEKLRQADHNKNEFLDTLSYELRNPLASIRASLDLLDRVPVGGEQARQAREVIEQYTAQISRLVDDLLRVTRITRNQGPYTYILQCSDGSYYTGWTTDLDARLKAHNEGKGARYTRSRLPVRLVYWEAQPDRRAAMRREAKIRKLKRNEKIMLIDSLAKGSGEKYLD
ncbi:MAG: GIY-YIG nuclease superfamily protein [Pelotomaculum sp. PtaB.Bin104]|nr:MAG: GIY-YIG nuclease superfamily protein [Pelotomaculum sp. PtaB.Bin104]